MDIAAGKRTLKGLAVTEQEKPLLKAEKTQMFDRMTRT